MSDIPSISRQLRIKTGVAKRLSKEYSLYLREADEQQRKLDRLIAEHAEDWDIKNATKMMEESNKMIVDSDIRLANAIGELRDLVVSARKEPQLGQSEEFLKAEEVVEGVNT